MSPPHQIFPTIGRKSLMDGDHKVSPSVGRTEIAYIYPSSLCVRTRSMCVCVCVCVCLSVCACEANEIPPLGPARTHIEHTV